MKKILVAVMVALMFVLSACGEKEIKEAGYSGDFQNDPMYQEVMKIESCKEPGQLEMMLEDIYDEEITYNSLKFDVQTQMFKEPYQDFQFNVFSLYSTKKNKGKLLTDLYVFFKENQDKPVFVMDKDGTYLVGDYKVEETAENTYLNKVNAWSISDLFLCRNKYTHEACREDYAFMVNTMEYYTEFEEILSKNFDNNDSSVNNTKKK